MNDMMVSNGPSAGADSIRLLSDFGAIPTNILEASLRKWEANDGLVYMLAGAAEQASLEAGLSGLLRRFFAEGAFAGSDGGGGLAIDLGHPWLQLLQLLKSKGYVEEVGHSGAPRWVLTGMGIAAVRTARVLHKPALVAALGPLALQDATPYQLVAHLRRLGWSWAALPKSIRERAGSAHTLQSPKVWFSGAVAPRPYLLCVSKLDEFLARPGVDRVPIGCPAKFYETLLGGGTLDDAWAAVKKRPAIIPDIDDAEQEASPWCRTQARAPDDIVIEVDLADDPLVQDTLDDDEMLDELERALFQERSPSLAAETDAAVLVEAIPQERRTMRPSKKYFGGRFVSLRSSTRRTKCRLGRPRALST